MERCQPHWPPQARLPLYQCQRPALQTASPIRRALHLHTNSPIGSIPPRCSPKLAHQRPLQTTPLQTLPTTCTPTHGTKRSVQTSFACPLTPPEEPACMVVEQRICRGKSRWNTVHIRDCASSWHNAVSNRFTTNPHSLRSTINTQQTLRRLYHCRARRGAITVDDCSLQIRYIMIGEVSRRRFTAQLTET